MERNYTSTAAAAIEPEMHTPPATVGRVAARVLENVAAGVGLAAITVSVAWAFELPMQNYKWPGVAGVAWVGALMFVRFSMDEAAVVIVRLRARHYRLRAEAAEERADALDTITADLRRQVAALSEQVKAAPTFVAAKPPEADTAMVDARRLVELRYKDGLPISRRYMIDKHQWPESRYSAATAILRVAGIINGNKWASFDSYDDANRTLSPAP